MTTTWTQADLEALESAIASGTLRVKYTDKEIWYRSLSEMMAIRDRMRQALGLTGRGVRLLAKHDKGL